MLICANKTPECSQKDSRKPVSVAGWPLGQNTGQAEIPSGQVQGIFTSIYQVCRHVHASSILTKKLEDDLLGHPL